MHAGSCDEPVPGAKPYYGDVRICEANSTGATPSEASHSPSDFNSLHSGYANTLNVFSTLSSITFETESISVEIAFCSVFNCCNLNSSCWSSFWIISV